MDRSILRSAPSSGAVFVRFVFGSLAAHGTTAKARNDAVIRTSNERNDTAMIEGYHVGLLYRRRSMLVANEADSSIRDLKL